MDNTNQSSKNGKLIRYRSQVNAFANILDKYFFPKQAGRMLDLGCGSGLETLTLQREIGVKTVGIDITNNFDSEISRQVELQSFDGLNIPYPDAYFGGVYSYHVLEHVICFDTLLGEVTRVLKPGGFAYFGVPNKSRLIAYFGTPGKSFFGKFRQNLVDYKDRLLGRFSNELGAHAGFSEKDLARRLAHHFSEIYSVSVDYYQAKLQRKKWPLRWVLHLVPQQMFWPSVYLFCVK